jgi:hypothetical protein
MKIFLTLLLSIFTIAFTSSQIILRGEITYQNTGESMDAIQICAKGATPTITYDISKKGVFNLSFPNGKVGDIAFIELISQKYELITDITQFQN